jgi:serine protease AprX
MGTPADQKGVLTVGAVWADGSLVQFSARGPTFDGRIKPEVLAPGVKIYVAKAPNSYVLSNGTSYSAPYVAGVAALIMQAHPDWTNHQVKEALMKTALNSTSPDVNRGWGVIQGLAALNYNFSQCSSSNCIHGACQNGGCQCNSGFYGFQCEIAKCTSVEKT